MEKQALPTFFSESSIQSSPAWYLSGTGFTDRIPFLPSSMAPEASTVTLSDLSPSFPSALESVRPCETQHGKEKNAIQTAVAKEKEIRECSGNSKKENDEKICLVGPNGVRLDLISLISQKQKDLEELTINEGLCAIEVDHLQQLADAKSKQHASSFPLSITYNDWLGQDTSWTN